MKAAGPCLTFWLPLRLVAHVQSREHWRKLHARATAQKLTTWAILTAAERRAPAGAGKPPFSVRIVRVGPRPMDDDNASGSAKHVRDTIAKCLGVDDGDRKAIRFTYGQKIGPFGVDVTIKGSP